MSDSPKQLPPYGLRMPLDLKERVQSAADRNNRSMNMEIVAALEEAYPPIHSELTMALKFLTHLKECKAAWEARENPPDMPRSDLMYLTEESRGSSLRSIKRDYDATLAAILEFGEEFTWDKMDGAPDGYDEFMEED